MANTGVFTPSYTSYGTQALNTPVAPPSPNPVTTQVPTTNSTLPAAITATAPVTAAAPMSAGMKAGIALGVVALLGMGAYMLFGPAADGEDATAAPTSHVKPRRARSRRPRSRSHRHARR